MSSACQGNLHDGIQWPSPNEARFWDRSPRTSLAPIDDGASSTPPEQDADPMHIVHITAEMAPIAKVKIRMVREQDMDEKDE